MTKSVAASYYNKKMLSSIKRVIRSGYKSFSRNLGPNAATVFVMVMVIFLITFLYFLNPVSDVLIRNIEERMDISIYFEEGIEDGDIFGIKGEISDMPEVKEIEYVSREEALERFTERFKDNPVIMESLSEIGRNPFLASLNIKAWQPSNYEVIAGYIEAAPFKSLINKVDYYERRPVIDKVASITDNLRTGGIIAGIILGIVAVLIALNTIRVAIYNAKEEISIMRLVGASNWFIRGPFIVQGVIIGALAVLISSGLIYGLSYFFTDRIERFIPGLDILAVYAANFWNLVLIQLAVGVGVGIFSSMTAVRKYLKI